MLSVAHYLYLLLYPQNLFGLLRYLYPWTLSQLRGPPNNCPSPKFEPTSSPWKFNSLTTVGALPQI